MKQIALLSVAKHIQYLNHLVALVAIEAERSFTDPFLADLNEDIEKAIKYHLDSIDQALERR